MSTDNLGNENIDMAVGYSNGYKQGYEQGKKDAVKHGHWVEGYPTETTDYFSCSVCNAGIFVDNSWRVSNKNVSEIYRYCRGCGAKMGGDCFV